MYVPRAHAVDDEHTLRRMVAEAETAQLVTARSDGYTQATLLPIIWKATHMTRLVPATILVSSACADDVPGGADIWG